MRVNLVNNLYISNINNKNYKQDINFKSNVSVGKIKPMINPNAAMNEFLARTMKLSRLRFQEILPELKNATNEIAFDFKKSKSYALEINPDNRNKFVVVLHGLGQNITNLQPLYESIIKNTNYAVVAPEYRGFGKNLPTKITEKSLLEDTQAAINYLKKKGVNPSDICIVGHSLGGYLASNLALANPDVSKLILVSSAESITNKSIDDVNISIPKFAKYLIKHAPILQGQRYRHVNTAKNLKKIDMPVYIIHSQNDRVIKSNVAQHLAESCKNLQSVEILTSGGHALDQAKISKIIDSLSA